MVQYNASGILEFIGFDKVHVKEAESCLLKFASLGATEKEAARGSMIEKVFPLAFGENVFTRGSANFEELRISAWSANCWLSPRVIITPSTAEQVSKILALCRFLGTKFSVCGGGHLQIPGFTSNDGGVVIDMSRFKDVTVSEDRSTCSFGPGLRWLELYQALDPHGLAVTGGRVAGVGVTGLLLGGGLSFQNSQHGFSASSVVDYEIILANSRIVHANSRENSDLFWALKGGCANFGIVTGFTMTTISNQIWAEARMYSPKQNVELIKAVMLFHEECEKDLRGTLVWQSVKECTVLVSVYCAPVEKPDVFKCFYDIPFQGNILEPKLRTISDAIGILGGIMTPGDNYLHEMITMSSLPDEEMYNTAQELHKRALGTLRDVEGIVLAMVLQPISSGAVTTSNAKGGNPLGLIAENQQWFLLLADFKNPKDEDFVHKILREMINTLEAVTKKNGTYLPYQYSNYAAKDQNPLASYGAENLQKLKDIAIRYDPDEVFQTLQNGGWLVSKA